MYPISDLLHGDRIETYNVDLQSNSYKDNETSTTCPFPVRKFQSTKYRPFSLSLKRDTSSISNINLVHDIQIVFTDKDFALIDAATGQDIKSIEKFVLIQPEMPIIKILSGINSVITLYKNKIRNWYLHISNRGLGNDTPFSIEQDIVVMIPPKETYETTIKINSVKKGELKLVEYGDLF